MVARFLTFGLLALGVLQNPSAQQGQQRQWSPLNPLRFLLLADRLSEEITGMQVMENGINGVPSLLLVNLQGHVGTLGKLDGMTIQVWLLRADGTTATQTETETLPCYDCFQSIPPTDYRQFRFAPIPAKELAGVVVSVNGKLIVREIKASSRPLTEMTMLVRPLLIGLTALAILPVSQEHVTVRPSVPVSPSPVWLLRVAQLSDDVSQLSVISHSEDAGTPAFIEVSLYGKHGNDDPKRLPIQTIQVWLLRENGAVVARMPKSFHGFPLTDPTTDIYPDAVSFDFVSVPPKEVSGVVVSVNGKLYVREIKPS